MMDYDPSLATGLRGDKYLDEQYRISEPGVYAIQLSMPADLEPAWDDLHDARPGYWDELESADGVIYVGASKDVHSRLRDHIEGKVRQTALTAVCPPYEVLSVKQTDTPFEDEYNFAVEMREQHPGAFVHTN